MQQRAVEPERVRKEALGERDGISDYRFEDRLHISGRVRDHAQDLARRRLVRQSLGEVAIAILQFFEQPNVFNRDHGLVREGLKKGYLLIAKRANFRPANQNCPNRNVLAHQRHDQDGSIIFLFSERLNPGKLGRNSRPQILNVDQLALDKGPTSHRTSVNR